MITVSVAYVLSFFIIPIFSAEGVQAEPGVESVPTLSVSPSSTVTFTVNPGTFNSGSETISVFTNNYTGYTLTLSTSSISNALVHGENSDYTIPSISGTKTFNEFNNSWGYSLDGANYKAIPSPEGDGEEIDSTTEANSEANTYTLTFGAHVAPTTPAGTYTNTITITAVSNPAGYTITYDANAGTDTVTNMPSPNPAQGTISGVTVNLANITPTRSGYTFRGWNTEADGSGDLYQAGGSFPLDPEATNTLTLHAIWGCGGICYDDNGADEIGGGKGTMANQVATANSSRILEASNYSRAGYGFAGWSEVQLDPDDANFQTNLSTAVTNNQVYGPNATITIPASGILQLYAVWVPKSTTYTMQAFTTSACNVMSDGDIIALEDTRDGQVYSVVKLHKNVGESNEYGQCWMMENLRLDIKNANITADNTNHPTSNFLAERANATWQICGDRSIGCMDQISYSTNNTNRNYIAVPYGHGTSIERSWFSYGGIYNWYASTAGNGISSQANNNEQRVGGDICPSGWHLPTGGYNGDYSALHNVASLIPNSSGYIRDYPYNYVIAGDYLGSSTYWRGVDGYYWTPTPSINNNYDSYYFGFDTTGHVWYTNTNYKYVGRAVRCLSNVSEERFSLSYNANGGYNAPTSQYETSTSRSFTFTLSTQTPTYSGLTFSGWATSATATEAEVQAGEEFEAIIPSTTLYAVWKPQVIVQFNPSGGTGTMSNMGVPSGKSKNLMANTFTKSGYSFSGWSTTESSTEVVYTDSASYTAPIVTEDTTVTLYAVWGRSRKVTYDSNNATDGTMTQTHSTSEYAPITLYAPNFYRTDYGFAGWSETQVDPTATNALTTISTLASQGEIYGPNETITVPAYEGSTSAMTLYAVWVPKDTTDNLQTFASTNRCSTMSEGDIIALQDSRDNNVYTVAKLADGNCWMTENLRLDPSDNNTTITTGNTNNPTSTFINTDIAQANITDNIGKKAYTNNYFRTCQDSDSTNGPTCADQISFGLGNLTGTTADPSSSGQSSRWYAYGIMYNWYTATAGNGTYNSNGSGVVASGDICPSGWHLPYGGSGTGINGGNTSGGFYYLASRLGATSSNATSSKIWRSFPSNFVYSGEYYGSSAYGRGNYGYYWSSTTVNNSSYYLYFLSSSSNPGTYSDKKYYGYAVRCIVKTNYTLIYDANGGTGAPSSQTSYSGSGSNAFTLSSLEPTYSNHFFMGWSTNPNAIIADYQPGDTFTTSNTANTLYAVWGMTFDMAYEVAGKSKTDGYYVMQDITPSICNDVTVGQTGTLIDIRDGQTYSVAKWKMNSDGSLSTCWMSSNLNLGADTLSVDLTSSNTNINTTISAATFNSWTVVSSSLSETTPELIPITTSNSSNGLDADSYNNKYGTLYNYAAASAETIAGSSNTSDAEHDLCPAGWRLPTGGSTGEFSKLVTDGYNIESSASGSIFIQDNLSFPLSGYFVGVSGSYGTNEYPTSQGSGARYWSSTSFDSRHMDQLFISSSSIELCSDYSCDNDFHDLYTRATGSAIRCIVGSYTAHNSGQGNAQNSSYPEPTQTSSEPAQTSNEPQVQQTMSSPKSTSTRSVNLANTESTPSEPEEEEDEEEIDSEEGNITPLGVRRNYGSDDYVSDGTYDSNSTVSESSAFATIAAAGLVTTGITLVIVGGKKKKDEEK